MKKGFTLMEMVLSMVLMSFIMLVFLSMTSLNFDFMRLSNEANKSVQTYAANNTLMYRKLLENDFTFTNSKITFETGDFFELTEESFNYNGEELYKLTNEGVSKIEQVGNLFKIELYVENEIEFIRIVVERGNDVD